MNSHGASRIAALTLLYAIGVRAEAPPNPAAIAVPAGQVPALTVRGDGVQIYECAAQKDAPERFAWTLKAPDAVLRDAAGDAIGRHYAGPTWEASDGSQVTGEAVAKADAPDGDAVPWLLLRAKSTSGSGLFGDVLSIQRLRTTGGKAPVGGCDRVQAGREARIPYSADYRFFTAASSPVGLWKTYDDKTGEARALVRIYGRDGRLFGRIEKTFTPGGEHRVCVPCTDERKDQPVIGLVIIRHMNLDGSQYDGGDILDPESGSVYRCKMHLEQDGMRLVLRGYIGISLLGRTQTWERQG